jgi:hypothetical protein
MQGLSAVKKRSPDTAKAKPWEQGGGLCVGVI